MSPNMAGEVIEAIHLMYEDYPDVEADCYLFLSKVQQSKKLQDSLKASAEKALEERGRCPKCGHIMEYYNYSEYHVETGDFEPMSELVCPVCDLGKADDRY